MTSSSLTRSYLKSPSTPRMSGDGVSALIDNVATYPTPEGLSLTLMPAGFLPRLSAWLIDSLIKLIALSIISVVGAFFGDTGVGLIAIGYFLINWLYPVYFEVHRDGMTPGKKSRDIYVCHDDGTPITLQASLIRNLLRVADFLPLFFVSAILSMLFNKKSQRLGDIVAGTIVVYRNDDDVRKLFKSVYGMTSNVAGANLDDKTKPSTNTRTKFQGIGGDDFNNGGVHNSNVNSSHTFDTNDSRQVNINSPLFYYPLTLTEQQALLSFAERAPFLSKARQVEIASNLAPLMAIDTNTPNQVGSSPNKEAQIIHTLYQRIRNIQGYSADTSQPQSQMPLSQASVTKDGI